MKSEKISEINTKKNSYGEFFKRKKIVKNGKSLEGLKGAEFEVPEAKGDHVDDLPEKDRRRKPKGRSFSFHCMADVCMRFMAKYVRDFY